MTKIGLAVAAVLGASVFGASLARADVGGDDALSANQMGAIRARMAERCWPSCTVTDPDGNGEISLIGVQIQVHGVPGYLVEQRGGSGGDWYGVLVRRADGWHHVFTAELAMGVQVLKTSHGGYYDLAVITKAYTTGGRRPFHAARSVEVWNGREYVAHRS